jgi:uncharacterized protein YneF (UPF0154 family)
MDTLLAVKFGYFVLWAMFASLGLWFARRQDTKERLRRSPPSARHARAAGR